MPGLDIPAKLRRGIGKGRPVPEDELAKRLGTYDVDRDGALTVAELAEFFQASQVGGPWFCQTVAKTLWRMAEDRLSQPIPAIAVEALAKVIHFSMSQPPRRDKRYVITPDVVQGRAPARSLADARRPQVDAPGSSGQGAAAPRALAPPRAGGAPAPRRVPRALPRRPGPKPRQ